MSSKAPDSNSAAPLRLRISAKASRAHLNVEKPPGASANAPLNPPYDESEQYLVLARLEQAATSQPSEIAQLHAEVGKRLFDSLLPAGGKASADIRARYDTAAQEAKGAGKPLPLQIQFDANAVTQAALPWELIHDGQDYPVFNETIHLNRFITYYGDRRWMAPLDGELRILFVISRPRDLPHLDDYAERSVLAQALQAQTQAGRVVIDTLEESTFKNFKKSLKKGGYHVVHFDGHGALPEGRTEGVLAFEQEDLATDPVTARQMAKAVEETGVRLVVLSACQSGKVEGNTVLNGVGPALLRARVPAVVSFQYTIPMTSTMAFTGAFYDSLARGEPLAAAVADGRRAMTDRFVTWFFPALYLRAADGDGFLFSPEPQDHALARVTDLRDLAREWKAMNPKERKEYDEGPPALVIPGRDGEDESGVEDEDEFEKLLDLMEEGMDLLDAMQEFIEDVEELADAMDGEDDGGTGAGDDGTAASPPANAQPQGSEPPPPQPAIALLPDQGLLKIEAVRGLTYQITAGGAYVAQGTGDSQHALEEGQYAIVSGQLGEVGQARVAKQKEVTVSLNIGRANIKTAFEGTAFMVVDPATNTQMAGWGSEWFLKPGGYEARLTHHADQGAIASFSISAGQETDVEIKEGRAQIKTAFPGTLYHVVNTASNTLVGGWGGDGDWRLMPGSYSVRLVNHSDQGEILSFTVGPAQEVEPQVKEGRAQIKTAFPGTLYHVVNTASNTLVGGWGGDGDWRLMPGSYSVRLVNHSDQGEILSFTVGPAQEVEPQVKEGRAQIKTAFPGTLYHVVNTASNTLVGGWGGDGDWRLMPGSYSVRLVNHSDQGEILSFTVGPAQEVEPQVKEGRAQIKTAFPGTLYHVVNTASNTLVGGWGGDGDWRLMPGSYSVRLVNHSDQGEILAFAVGAAQEVEPQVKEGRVNVRASTPEGYIVVSAARGVDVGGWGGDGDWRLMPGGYTVIRINTQGERYTVTSFSVGPGQETTAGV